MNIDEAAADDPGTAVRTPGLVERRPSLQWPSCPHLSLLSFEATVETSELLLPLEPMLPPLVFLPDGEKLLGESRADVAKSPEECGVTTGAEEGKAEHADAEEVLPEQCCPSLPPARESEGRSRREDDRHYTPNEEGRGATMPSYKQVILLSWRLLLVPTLKGRARSLLTL